MKESKRRSWRKKQEETAVKRVTYKNGNEKKEENKEGKQRLSGLEGRRPGGILGLS